MRHLYTSLASLFIVFLISSGLASALMAQNALDFDGTNDFVQTPYDGITGTNSRTVEAWIKADFQTTQMVITDWGNMNIGQRFTFNLINGRIRCEIGGNGVTGTTLVADSTWHHVAVTFDDNASPKYRTYVDGVLEASFNLTVAINTSSTTNFRIGRRVDNANPFVGCIDEVRVYDYARTATEIANSMNAEYCTVPTGMVAYYKLNEGTAGGTNTGINTTYDASGNGNNGTLNNFALTGAGSNWVNGVALATGTLAGTATATGCDGSYTSPSGNTYTQSGTYVDTILSTAGCDSILTITLNFNSSSAASIAASECYSYASPSGSNTWTTSGIYQDTIANAAGCDSVLTIDLSINASYDTINATGCGSYTSPSGNNTWFNTGTYFDTLTNSVGCDSNLFIFLQMENDVQTTVTESACISYTSPSGLYTWTASGTYQDTLVASTGCDSVLTIDLDVTEVDTQVTVTGQSLSAAAIGANVTYRWINCNTGNEVDGATQKIFEPANSGSYAVVVTNDGCSDTSACNNVTVIGISELNPAGLSIYPNPTDGRVTILLENALESLTVLVYDVRGQLLQQHAFTGTTQQELALPSTSGVYFIEVEQGGALWRRRVIRK